MKKSHLPLNMVSKSLKADRAVEETPSDKLQKCGGVFGEIWVGVGEPVDKKQIAGAHMYHPRSVEPRIAGVFDGLYAGSSGMFHVHPVEIGENRRQRAADGA